MYTSMFQGQNTSSFGAVLRKAYVASLRKISPKGEMSRGSPAWLASGLPLANTAWTPPGLCLHPLTTYICTYTHWPGTRIVAYYSEEHYIQPKNAPAIVYEAGLLAHTTIVGGGVTGLSRMLRATAVRRCCMPASYMPGTGRICPVSCVLG